MIETLWSVRDELVLVAVALFWPAFGLALEMYEHRRLSRMAHNIKGLEK